jgi:hypothetical protein
MVSRFDLGQVIGALGGDEIALQGPYATRITFRFACGGARHFHTNDPNPIEVARVAMDLLLEQGLALRRVEIDSKEHEPFYQTIEVPCLTQDSARSLTTTDAPKKRAK